MPPPLVEYWNAPRELSNAELTARVLLMESQLEQTILSNTQLTNSVAWLTSQIAAIQQNILHPLQSWVERIAIRAESHRAWTYRTGRQLLKITRTIRGAICALRIWATDKQNHHRVQQAVTALVVEDLDYQSDQEDEYFARHF